MSSLNKKRRGKIVFGSGQGRNQTAGGNDLLTPEQQLTETILSVGILPTLCIIGLVACFMFLHAVWRKRRNGTKNHLSIIIAVFNASYLLLTLEERIEYSLTTQFGIGGGLDKNIKDLQRRIAKFCLHMGTAIICVHSIEVCHAVLRPMTYRKTWTKKKRFIVAAAVCVIGFIFYVSCVIADFTIDGKEQPKLHYVRNSIEDGFFSILMISTIICCYVITIVKRMQQILFKSTAIKSSKNDPTKKIVRSLVLASSVYLIFGVPVDVIKIILVFTRSVDRRSITFWAMKIAQNTMEVMYGSALLCVYILNEVSCWKRPCCCSCHTRVLVDESDVKCGARIASENGSENDARCSAENDARNDGSGAGKDGIGPGSSAGKFEK